ncbi:amidohydrolase family protein [Rhizobium sp. FKY42]|uniref:amidohydrolase family protein n=1 Tax=Rhizobium sp. FKY42 TaxID=2562310 RepID=UPI0010C0839B|nr:amidohydrolase family protein [Rhizobium sp. FKY42]
MPVIDAHQHFWRRADRIGEWPTSDLAAIFRDFEPDDLEPLLQAAGVDGTVLVQTRESEDDTAYMLDLADHYFFIRGVVGWTDLKATDAAERISKFAKHPKLKGLRPMLQGISDLRWICDVAVDPAIEAMTAHDLAFDALILPPHLPHFLEFAKMHSQLRIVIDHGAKPYIADGKISDWRKGMEALSRLPNVACKLSGLLTEAGDQKPQSIRPYAETILDLFGPARTLWGSDWPVLRLAGNYQRWHDQCRDIVSAEHHQAIFGENAINFYRLNG